jgi:hypothetical protein
MDLAGANRATHVAGMDQLPGTANYFIGNDPAKWRSGAPTISPVAKRSARPMAGSRTKLMPIRGNQAQSRHNFRHKGSMVTLND